MKSHLFKWTSKDGWHINPSNGFAYMDEIVYAQGDEDIEASAAEDGCRVILFYDEQRKKAALIHTSDHNGTEYRDLIDKLKSKKFSAVSTKVVLCGDEAEEEHKSWSDDIESYIQNLGYVTKRIWRGPGKNVFINPGRREVTITDRTGYTLEDYCSLFDANKNDWSS